MCTSKRRGACVTLLGAMVVSALWAVTVPATAATPAQSRVTVTPAVVGRGGMVIISGSVSPVTCPVPGGGAPGGLILTSDNGLFPPDGFGPDVPRNASGGFSTPYTLPITVTPGTYTVGLRCGGGAVGVFANLQVTSQQVSAPTALANSPSLMNVFFTTSAGQIGNDYWTPSRGWTTQTLPGPADAVSTPAALANSPSLMNVFFTTSAGQIGNDYWTPSRGWTTQTLPGPADAVSAPAALANSPSLINLFFATTSGQIGNDYWTPSRGWTTQTLPGFAAGGAGTPSAVANSPSQMNVFTASGALLNDDSWTSSGGWINQMIPGPLDAVSAPSALANSPALMNVFFTTPSEQIGGQIGNEYWTPSGGWTSQILPGPTDAVSAPSALPNSPSLMNVFLTTLSGQIGNDYWTPSRGWTSQTLPGPTDAVSAPSALANSPSLMNLFFVTISGQIGNDYWTPSGGWITQTLPGPGPGA